MTSGNGVPSVHLLPQRRDSGTRAALTARLRRMGVPLVVHGDAVPHVVLVGLGGGRATFEAAARSVAATGLPHLGLGGHGGSDTDLVDAALAGLQGWLPPTVGDGALLGALRDVAAGRTAWTRGDTAVLVRALRRQVSRQVPRSDGPAVELSLQEYRVLELLAGGRSTATVAKDLGISPVTVRGYVSTAARRLGADSREHAVALFRRRDHAPLA